MVLGVRSSGGHACAFRPDERFYGFGHQYTYLDAAGRVLPVFVREQVRLLWSMRSSSSRLQPRLLLL